MSGASDGDGQGRADSAHRKARHASAEVMLYVGLSFLGIIVVFFATSCMIYSWKGAVSKQSTPPLSPTSTTTEGDMPDSVTNVRDWVWLGRATLNRASGVGTDSTSIGLSDINGNNQTLTSPTDSRLVRQGTDDSTTSCMSTSYAENDPLINETKQFGATFVRDNKGGRRFSSASAKVASKKYISEQKQRRNVGVRAHSMIDQPPPIPPHGINVIANPLPHNINENNFSGGKKNKNKKVESPKFVEVNADDFVRLRGVTRTRAGEIRRATIMENPMHSDPNARDSDSIQNSEQLVDYDKLLSYFSALKESNA